MAKVFNEKKCSLVIWETFLKLYSCQNSTKQFFYFIWRDVFNFKFPLLAGPHCPRNVNKI